MSLLFFHRRRAERFAQLLEPADGGPRTHSHSRSKLDAKLAELVAISNHVGAVDPPAARVDPDFRAGLRAMLVATAEREGIGATARSGPNANETFHAPRQTSTARRSGGGTRPTLKTGRGRTRGAIIIGVAVGAVAVSGMSAASENAVPGDPLYTVKRSAERAQLALASSEINRGQLHLEFARTRLSEAERLRENPQGLAAALNAMDAEIRQGVQLLNRAAVSRRYAPALQPVAKFLVDQSPRVRALADGLDGQLRARANHSLALLNAVSLREQALADMLVCKTPVYDMDSLGPRPQRRCD